MSLLEVNNLHVSFKTRTGYFEAVRGVSFSINEGEILGIVGESGSGKSVSSFALLSLLPQHSSKVKCSEAHFNGKNLLQQSNKVISKIRGNEISMIFQDPMTSLNPFLKIGTQLMEPLIIHKDLTKNEAKKRAISVLKEVGISEPEKRLKQYPHQFSGGMRQRVMIAMALITEPKLLIADEPTTALDVTIQAQILDLIKKLQKNHNTAIIFITHDLGVIASLADKISVMYAGEIIEHGEVKEIFYHPKHPYTEALLDSIPASHVAGEELYAIPGHPPKEPATVKGCIFAERCRYKEKQCLENDTYLQNVNKNHLTSCLKIQSRKLEIDNRGSNE